MFINEHSFPISTIPSLCHRNPDSEILKFFRESLSLCVAFRMQCIKQCEFYREALIVSYANAGREFGTLARIDVHSHVPTGTYDERNA